MKNYITTLISIGGLLIGFTIGQLYQERIQTCDVFDVPVLEREAYTAIIAEPEQEVTGLCEETQVPFYLPCECDCAIDMEVGRVNGWAECVQAEQAVTSEKEKEDYCRKHYCQEKILRRTRPTTR